MRKAIALVVLTAFAVLVMVAPVFAGPIGIQPPELSKKPGYELPKSPKFGPRPKPVPGPAPKDPVIVPGPKPVPKPPVPVPKPVPKDPAVKLVGK